MFCGVAANEKDGLVDITQARVWLARAILPINAQASEAERLEAAAVVSRDTQNIDSCDAMSAIERALRVWGHFRDSTICLSPTWRRRCSS